MYDTEQEEVIPVPCRYPRRIIQVDQRALRQFKSDIKKSKDKLFFINHIAAGSAQAKLHLLHVDMDQSDTVTMRDYRLYR